MQTTVGVHGDRLILGAAEADLGLVIAMGEIVDVSSVLGLEVDELDVMVFCHRVRAGAYADQDRVVVSLRDHRQMVLHRGSGCVGRRHVHSLRLYVMRLEKLHLVTTADRDDGRTDHFGDDVATDRAEIKLRFHIAKMIKS